MKFLPFTCTSGKENLRLIVTMRVIPQNRIDDALKTAGLEGVANKKIKLYSLG
ncbi:MAG: hypothetical protein ABIN94_18195 [Ferruginibacter sp.]